MVYPAWNNTTIGLDGMAAYLGASLDTVFPGVGGSFIGFTFLLPLWAIIFLILSRLNPLAGFTVASFICWIGSVFLIALQMMHPAAFGILFAMWVVGALAFYMQSRD